LWTEFKTLKMDLKTQMYEVATFMTTKYEVSTLTMSFRTWK